MIIKETGNHNIALYNLDLSSMHSVRKCAQEILLHEQRLDILVKYECEHQTSYGGGESTFNLKMLFIVFISIRLIMPVWVVQTIYSEQQKDSKCLWLPIILVIFFSPIYSWV